MLKISIIETPIRAWIVRERDGSNPYQGQARTGRGGSVCRVAECRTGISAGVF
jgi:hypothetical protein